MPFRCPYLKCLLQYMNNGTAIQYIYSSLSIFKEFIWSSRDSSINTTLQELKTNEIQDLGYKHNITNSLWPTKEHDFQLNRVDWTITVGGATNRVKLVILFPESKHYQYSEYLTPRSLLGVLSDISFLLKKYSIYLDIIWYILYFKFCFKLSIINVWTLSKSRLYFS